MSSGTYRCVEYGLGRCDVGTHAQSQIDLGVTIDQRTSIEELTNIKDCTCCSVSSAVGPLVQDYYSYSLLFAYFYSVIRPCYYYYIFSSWYHR